MEASQPPVPPAVAAQQGAPPLQQFAQGAAGQGGGQQMPSSDQLIGQYIDQLGATMTKLAEVTVKTKPELTPILKQAIQALAMFAGKVKTAPQGQQGQPGAQAGAPDGGSQGTAGTGSPDAGGGAALGMPQ